ncbi:MAG: glycosyltransferase family 39 protein [Rhodospirillaceae bacterium]|nr:glycosyltransferase family 39 protein [Rhodospirillales bacterium]
MAGAVWVAFYQLNGIPLLDPAFETGKYTEPAYYFLGLLPHDNPERLPLYPAIIWLTFSLFGVDNYLALALVQCLFTGGATLGIALAARAIRVEWTWPAALLACVWLNLSYRTALLLPDLTFTTFVAGALAAMLWAVRSERPVRFLATAVVMLDCALLTRPAVLGLPILMLPLLIWALRGRRHWSWVKIALTVACLGTALGVASLPQFLRSHAHTGQWLFTLQAGDHALHVPPCLAVRWGCGNSSDAVTAEGRRRWRERIAALPEGERDDLAAKNRLGKQVALEMILEQPPATVVSAIIGSWTKLMLHNVGSDILDRLHVPFLLPGQWFSGGLAQNLPGTVAWTIMELMLLGSRVLQVVGVVDGLRNRERRVETLLLLAVVAAFLAISVGFGNHRYRTPMEPALLVLTLMGWQAVSTKWRRR